jgi:peptide/nickel transport system permease protein
MQRYIVIRLFQALITLFVISIIVFGLGRMTGNPLDVMLPLEATQEDKIRLEKAWGLDRPIVEQYFKYMGNLLQGDFGGSWKWPSYSAIDLILDRFPATVQLAGFALLISTALALPLGVLSAVMKDSPFDYAGKVLALLGQSLPPFWLGIVLMWIFAVELELVPTSGKGGVKHLILPAISIGLFNVAALMRLVRSSMLDVLDSEYVKLARIKGLAEWKVIWKHGLRNAAIAPLTYFGIILGGLLVGSITIETVFSWPGVGLLAVDAVRARDFQVVQAVVLFFAIIFILANLLVDITYAYLDPRIRYQ